MLKQDSDSLEKDYLKLGILIFLADPLVSLASQGGVAGLAEPHCKICLQVVLQVGLGIDCSRNTASRNRLNRELFHFLVAMGFSLVLVPVGLE